MASEARRPRIPWAVLGGGGGPMAKKHKQCATQTVALFSACLMFLGGNRARAVEEFHAHLTPALLFVNLGTDFQVDFGVDGSARQFNGYEALIRYDPTLAGFRAVEEGSLMTQACVNRFRALSTPTDSTVDYVHVILCDGVSLNGPGTLSRYTFHADQVGSFELRVIGNPDHSFYDAGEYVAPDHPTYPRQVVLHAATVVILDPVTDVEDSAVPAGQLVVRQAPNPSHGAGTIQLDLPEKGPVEIEIVDPTGRRVWVYSGAELRGGAHSIPWGELGPRDRALPAGAYFCRIRAGRFQGSTTFCVIR
jgi:hypothetical protein